MVIKINKIISQLNNRKYNPTTSLIIATKDRPNDIDNLLNTIIMQTVVPNEIFIIDSSINNDTREIIKIKGNNLPLYYKKSLPGLTHQRNVGIAYAKGEIIFFLDDDMLLDRKYFEELIKIFNSQENIGGVYGNIISKTDKISYIKSLKRKIIYFFQMVIAKLFFIYHNNTKGKFLLSGLPTYVYGFDKIINVEFVPGGLCAYKRHIFQEFEFDEHLIGYCWGEDDDFSYRVSRKYINKYTPYAKAIHNVSKKSRDTNYERIKMIIRNHKYLFKKNIKQDIKHKIAFRLSIFGILLNQTLDSIIHKDIKGFKAIIESIRYIYK